MALKLRKDVKKSSYYVWFLGAKESKGLRGSEYIIPVIKHLEEREKDVEPFKVTLQVSHKGLKIVQNILSQNPKNSKPKNETIKHFIPHNTITCVYQQEDIIACILLLFNPVTKCPLHVHAYRCDSLETATLLKNQLQLLIDRPENQKKYQEIENRLKPSPQQELKKVDSSIGSDTGTSTRESESSEERYGLNEPPPGRLTTLYDSVAAELRAKLASHGSPILLPPRDYDTVHRTRGNLTGIELRRCLNANVVGRTGAAQGNQQSGQKRRVESSGASSGIGSDHPPSPDSPDADGQAFNGVVDNQSTSDEDWNGDPAESTVYLMHQTAHQMTLPRPSGGGNREGGREKSPEVQRFNRYPESKTLPYEEDDYRQSTTSLREETHKYLEQPVTKYTTNKFIERQKSFDKMKVFQRQKSFGELELKSRVSKSLDKEKYFDSLPDKYYYQSSGRELDREDKFDGYCEEDMLDRYSDKKYISRSDRDKNGKYYEDDGFDENIKYRSKHVEYEKKSPSQRYSYDDAEYFDEYRREEISRPVPKTRQKYPKDHYNDQSGYDSEIKVNRPKSADSRYYADQEPVKSRSINNDYNREYSRSEIREEWSKPSQELFDSNSMGMRNGRYRQRSPDSHVDEIKAPRDRFKDAKEKFLLMEKERLEKERSLKRPESPISPVRRYDNHSRTNHDDRYYDSRREREHEEVQLRPKPAPRQRVEADEPPVRYRERNSREREAPVERYRHTDKLDPKRRSMYSLIEEERRKNSSEIAKELKRRSYMEGRTFEEDPRSAYPRGHYQDLPDPGGFPDIHSKSGMEPERSDTKFTKNQKMTKNAAGYRHSYAEPKLRTDKSGGKKHFAEVLHRTNSTAGGNGRVGIASLHPY